MIHSEGGFTYILTNKNHTVLYAGACDDIEKRVQQHKDKVYPNAFTARYNVCILVYYQFYDSIEQAFEEEERLKAGSRKKKLELIKKMNSGWKDLFGEWL